MADGFGYKVLSADAESCHGGTGTWKIGKPRHVSGLLIPCQRGIHYCRRDQLVQWLGPRIYVFEDLTPNEAIDAGDKMVTRKGRVVEELTAWDGRTARLFASDCAEAVIHMIPEAQRAPFADAIAVARRFANGEATNEERAAARAAAWDAAWDAARDAARDAAGAAARAAAWDAAWDAARDAAGAAAGAAAWAAAWAAARDAARAAAWNAQTELLFKYLEA